MVKKEIGLVWSELANKAFEAFKKCVTEAPILRHYHRKKKAILETDSPYWCIGGLFSQYDDEGVLHSVAFTVKR